MAKTKTKKSQREDTEQMPVVVLLRPGTAVEKSLRYVLPENMRNNGVTIDQTIDYGLGLREEDGIKREGLRIQERLRTEMREKYGISINSRSVQGRDRLADYLEEKESPAKTPYKQAEIIVASRQEGAWAFW